jgi:hypothetical protein
VNGTNFWFHASDRSVVHLFPAIRNGVSRNDLTERRIILSVERMLEIAAQAESISDLAAEVMDAQKSVSRGKFSFLAVVIAAEVLPVPVSSEVIRTIQLAPVFSNILNTVARFAPSSRCPVIQTQNAMMRLCERLQRRCGRQEANDFSLILPPATAWSELVSAEQTRFAGVRVISEYCCHGSLSLTENDIVGPMKFQCRIAFAICDSSSTRFATDRLSVQIDAHFRLPFEYCNEWRTWRRIPIIIALDGPGNLAVILSHRSPKNHILRIPPGFVAPFRARSTARAKSHEYQILKEAIALGNMFQSAQGKLVGLDPANQHKDSLTDYSLLSCVFPWIGAALRRRLLAANSLRIARLLLEALGGESAEFASLPQCRFVSMTIAVQLAPLFTRTELYHFEVNCDRLLMLIVMVGFMGDSNRNSETSPGFPLMNKQASGFYLCGPILCHLQDGQVGLCWRELARLIRRQMVGFAGGEMLHEMVPVVAVLPVVVRIETAVIGHRVLIKLWCRLNCNKGKP